MCKFFNKLLYTSAKDNVFPILRKNDSISVSKKIKVVSQTATFHVCLVVQSKLIS